jgi:hypothetical protein
LVWVKEKEGERVVGLRDREERRRQERDIDKEERERMQTEKREERRDIFF